MRCHPLFLALGLVLSHPFTATAAPVLPSSAVGSAAATAPAGDMRSEHTPDESMREFDSIVVSATHRARDRRCGQYGRRDRPRAHRPHPGARPEASVPLRTGHHGDLELLPLRGAIAYARGDNRTEDAPLYSVDPLTATLGRAFDGDRWDAELADRLAASKRRVSDPALYRQGGFGVLDLLAHWTFAPGARMNAGVFNLADRSYI